MARGLRNYTSSSYWKYKIRKIFKGKPEKGELALIYSKFLAISGLDKSIRTEVIDEEDLNTNDLDQEIELSILKYFDKNKSKFIKFDHIESSSFNVAVAFTELYATGGHTPMVERFIESFCEEYKLKVFCTRSFITKKGDYSRKKNGIISKNISIDGIDFGWNDYDLESRVKAFYNKIICFTPKIIFCYIHPQDVVLTATLALIKKNSDIKVVDINMQDHFYSLGFKFADLIIDARPAGQRITKEVRGYYNTTLMPLQQKRFDETVYFSDLEILSLRRQLGIREDNFFTLTGGAGYKYFGKNDSDYFKLIKNILSIEEKLVHVVMSDFDEDLFKIVHKIFEGNENLLQRLRIIRSVPEYDIYMQACDFFIDTLPQGGALIHIDIMRNKKLSVVKINKENPVRSFEFYFPKNYNYMFDDLYSMEKAIIDLLYNKSERERVSEELFNYYVNTYEFNVVKSKYKKIIENHNNLEQFYGYSFY